VLLLVGEGVDPSEDVVVGHAAGLLREVGANRTSGRVNARIAGSTARVAATMG
jgi:hypothetical protein